ncbi:hypothetical protein [Mobilicoccus caccae]|nr:hypothetical protein [Mobilicoccus caccae]
MTFEGYEPGSRGYRRITISLFLAGVATFALLYSTQPCCRCWRRSSG